jgi:hypothetical protein
MKTPDAFTGFFDNTVTLRREYWDNGRMGRYAAKNCTGNPSSPWPELRAPWGDCPDLPSNAQQQAA